MSSKLLYSGRYLTVNVNVTLALHDVVAAAIPLTYCQLQRLPYGNSWAFLIQYICLSESPNTYRLKGVCVFSSARVGLPAGAHS